MTKDPSSLDGESIRHWLDENQLTLVSLCTGHVFGEDRLGLVGPDLQISQPGMDRLKTFVDFGAAYFGEGTMVNLGRSRGPGDSARLEESWERAVKAFQELADYALSCGIRILLEPISIHEHKYILTTQDGIRTCQAVDRSNFGLVLDVYHMNIQDSDMLESFREAGELCWHVHISDQNRKWPGSGVLDFNKIISVLKEIDYDGYVSTEILPWPDPDTAARSSIETLRKYIEK